MAYDVQLLVDDDAVVVAGGDVANAPDANDCAIVAVRSRTDVAGFSVGEIAAAAVAVDFSVALETDASGAGAAVVARCCCCASSFARNACCAIDALGAAAEFALVDAVECIDCEQLHCAHLSGRNACLTNAEHAIEDALRDRSILSGRPLMSVFCAVTGVDFVVALGKLEREPSDAAVGASAVVVVVVAAVSGCG